VLFTEQVGCGAGNTIFPVIASYPDAFVYACDFSARAIELVKVGNLLYINLNSLSNLSSCCMCLHSGLTLVFFDSISKIHFAENVNRSKCW